MIRLKPADLPDPLAELLIFRLLAKVADRPADRLSPIIGDTSHDQRVECFQVGRSQPDIPRVCFPQPQRPGVQATRWPTTLLNGDHGLGE